MSNLVNQFSANLSKLSHAEKHIFYYIDSNINKAKNQSLTAMAESNNVSTTTIVRMCNKLGLSGFSELKYLLKNLDTTLVQKDNDYLENIKNSVSSSLSNLNMNTINNLVQLINTSTKIIIISVGLSKPMGEYFSKLLMQSNKGSFYIYESHIIDLIDKSADKNDLIIFISNSGETETLLKVAEKLSYRNFKTAAIVNSPDSTLSKLVQIPINSYSEKSNLSGYDITPRSTLLLIIDIIFGIYINSKK
ncbi:MurR/RpiR family transcriptional regulator [Clostridium gasigenes]|uniref:MurR/RpiR family transcriptional regulator n=1 Tax=Clostridium gasigenes TaxID=94869 RepID=UPI001C0D8761|nr:MurR/RpiR family transcriptional regulator [Clostridium gasigenes]